VDPEVERLLKKYMAKLYERSRPCCTVRIPPGYIVRSREEYERITSSCKVAFVMFYGELCPYCEIFDPIFKSVGSRYSDRAAFVKANAEYFIDVVYDLGIATTPAVVVYVNSSPIGVYLGYMTPRQFEEIVKENLANAGC